MGDAARASSIGFARVSAAHVSRSLGSRRRIRRLLPEADVAFTPFVDRDVFASARALRWVQSPAVGVGSLMFPELLASPVILTSARGIRARSMAEHVIGVTIALARLLPLAIRAQAAHAGRRTSSKTSGAMRTLHGQRMGIVGLGAIGREVVKIAAPFGFRVTAIRRRAGEPLPDGVDAVWTPDRLPDLLAQSDVVVLAAPHTPETKRLIGRAQIEQMKRGALLVNVARGKLVDDEALVDALRDGRLGGAALDVFTRGAARAVEPLLGSAERHRHAAHLGGDARTTGRRSSRCSPTTCAVSKKASRCSTSLIKSQDTDDAQDSDRRQVGRRRSR